MQFRRLVDVIESDIPKLYADVVIKTKEGFRYAKRAYVDIDGDLVIVVDEGG